MPVSEEPRPVLSDSIEPGPRLGWLASQSFELVHGPSNEVLVDAHCEGVQLGAVELTFRTSADPFSVNFGRSSLRLVRRGARRVPRAR